MMAEPSSQDLTEAANTAWEAMAAKADAYNVRRLRRYIMQELPRALGIIADKVELSISAGSDVIGIAAIARNGAPVAVSGSKADCLANPQQWVAARAAEIIALFEAAA